MRNKSGWIKLGVAFFAFAIVLALIAAGIFMFFFYSSRQVWLGRAQNTPPVVTVREPVTGTSAPANSFLNVSSTVTGVKPIVRVELWLDGILQETQKSESPAGISPFYANFSLLMPSAGSHTITVRAVDTAGIIGRSPMLELLGTAKSATTYLAVQVQEGQSLDEIAATFNTKAKTLQELNPGLGDAPAAGSTLKIPKPSKDKGTEPGPAAPPTLPMGSGPIAIPDVPAMQIMSDRSPGLSPAGPFLTDLFTGGNSPPAAPSGLQAEVKGCKVILRWDDNADDETSFYIYVIPVTYHGFSLPYAFLQPSPKTGPAWFEFQPPTGGSLNIWVDANNSYGSKSSNDVWVYIPYVSECAPIHASRLNFEVLDIGALESLDKAYCYISLENTPEQRVPTNPYAFIPMEGGKSKDMPYSSSFTIPIPTDGKIDLSGECDGWSGDAFKYIGTFNAVLGPETWNGARQSLPGKDFEIGVAIKPLAAMMATGMESVDPTLPAPYDVIEAAPPNDPWAQSLYPPSKTLRWKWDGDLSKIDGFQIFLNGEPYYNWTPIKGFEKIVQLPGECGQPVHWQLAARAGTALSALSTPFAYDLPACQNYLRVRFDNIYFWRTDDGAPGDMCDTLETYFKISVRDVTRSFWDTNMSTYMDCKGQSFKNMTLGPYPGIYGSEPYTITLPLSPGEDLYSILVKAEFWDSDPTWNPDDLYASFSEHLLGAYVPKPGEKWEMSETWKDTGAYTGYSSIDCHTQATSAKMISDEATSFLNFSYSVYPNKCRDKPPAEGF